MPPGSFDPASAYYLKATGAYGGPNILQEGPSSYWQDYGQQRVGDIYGGGQGMLEADVGAAEAEGLQALRDVATGRRSYALEAADRRQEATGADLRTRALSAQAGGLNPELERSRAWATAQAEQDIGRAGKLAATQEQQSAQRQLMGATTASLKRRQALQGMQQGYGAMGMEERWRRLSAQRREAELSKRKKRAALAAKMRAEGRGDQMTMGALQAGAGMLGMAGGMGG